MIKFKENHIGLFKQIGLHIAVIGLLFVWMLGIQRTSDSFLKNVVVHVDKVEGVKDLVVADEVRNFITKELPNDILNQKVNRIDLAQIEEMLSGDSRIHNVEVFVDAQQNMIVEIVQRRPVLRVINEQGEQYYIDQIGNYIRKGDYRAIRVPVATGYIENYSSNESLEKTPKLNNAFEIAVAIRKDPVLLALIEQMHFEKNGGIVLIPKIGKEKIILNHIDELEIKLGQLKAFYRELAKTDGWGKFKEIDISYKNVVYGRNPEQP